MDIDISSWDFFFFTRKMHWLGTELELGVWDIIKVPWDISYFAGVTQFKGIQKCKSNDFKIRLWIPALIWPLREVSCYYKTLQELQLPLIFINSNCWFFFKVKLMKSPLSENTAAKQDKGNHSSFLILSGKYLFWHHHPQNGEEVETL